MKLLKIIQKWRPRVCSDLGAGAHASIHSVRGAEAGEFYEFETWST